MSLSFDDIKKQQVGRWRIRKYYNSGYVVDKKILGFWMVRTNSAGKVILFTTVDLAKAHIDQMIQDDFVQKTQRGESEFTIYYP